MSSFVHGSNNGITERNGQNGPPDHRLIDVDSPGNEYVGDHKGITSTLEPHVVVVFSALRRTYLLAR